MKIVCIGGGPAGLYFSLLMKKQNPAHEIIVIERNRPDDTFGWGVVFSDQTLGNLMHADEESARAISQALNHWDDIDIHIKGQSIRSGGHGFCGIGRKRLLNVLQKRCSALGVALRFETDVSDDQAIAWHHNADLVIACDGLHSRMRTRYAHCYQPDIDTRRCRFIWLGTKKLFPAFTFAFEETEHGWFQAHAYQYDGDTSTFIVETPEDVWRKAGLDRMTAQEAIAFCEKCFAKYLDGHALVAQNPSPMSSNAPSDQGSSSWTTFPRIVCKNWVAWNTLGEKRVPVVLMGDAAHTVHFSIGSGTKIALEDAIELARCFERHPHGDMGKILAAYQDARAIEVRKLQSSAHNSMAWFENVTRYAHLDAEQFAYSLLTRSQRLSHDNLRMRDAGYIERYENWFAQKSDELLSPSHLKMPHKPSCPPMLTPFKARSVVLKNRIVVSPMAQYSAIDGLVGDYHLVHLGSRAMGGAGLVCAEMTAVSAAARITPGCPGLYRPEHTAAWRRIVDFAHANSDAKIAIQLGHAGPKGSTQRAWDGIDVPLDCDNWPLVAASAQQYIEGVSQVARAATEDDMHHIQQDFVRATQAAAEAGFDWLELHCAHGYLLSTFMSPLTNRRDDDFGGSLKNRCRYPLAVFAAVRAVWPQNKPISVRISAHDWVAGGITPDDAVVIARWFKDAGADMIDCSSGQVSKQEKPVYGRLFQTPFSDRIRNEVGIPTIAVGGISDADQVNSIIAAGRADLCAIARPHLANPAWTLTEAARMGYTDMDWPKPYRAAKDQLEKNIAREKQRDTTQRSQRSDAAFMGKPMMKPALALTGKHALVTGGGGGIGIAIAQSLLRQGACVTLLGRNAATLQRAIHSLQSEGLIAHVTADITQRDAVMRAFESAVAQQGCIDILINNAGQADSASLLKTDEALWNHMIAVNLTGTFHCTQAALPGMAQQGWGRIVNIASTAALKGYAYVSAYCAAKHGVVGLTRALALEVATQGITVNAVCPGYTDTAMLQDTLTNISRKTQRSPEQARQALADANPQKRLVRPEEVAHTVTWLCLPGSDALNGQAIAVAGGEIM